jgi:hypothetical protein
VTKSAHTLASFFVFDRLCDATAREVKTLDLAQVFFSSKPNVYQYTRKGVKMNTVPENDEKLREAVRERYSRTA